MTSAAVASATLDCHSGHGPARGRSAPGPPQCSSRSAVMLIREIDHPAARPGHFDIAVYPCEHTDIRRMYVMLQPSSPAFSPDRAATLLAGVAKRAPAPAVTSPGHLGWPGPRTAPPTSRINKLPLAWAFTPNGKRESETGAGSAPGLERSGPVEAPVGPGSWGTFRVKRGRLWCAGPGRWRGGRFPAARRTPRLGPTPGAVAAGPRRVASGFRRWLAFPCVPGGGR